MDIKSDYLQGKTIERDVFLKANNNELCKNYSVQIVCDARRQIKRAVCNSVSTPDMMM